ncbi:uncharacterized protein LOC119949882 [Tachyglossus aculeatus]|uniref:uncharacterized protein LOC119949882 n=1 Tax=Tachyglossus aculeatus TaxID=9261 RepID=UPI0018F3A3D6|nr:uncharacterized protein LOC119949882 [Tachyglossus aculeatus]
MRMALKWLFSSFKTFLTLVALTIGWNIGVMLSNGSFWDSYRDLAGQTTNLQEESGGDRCSRSPIAALQGVIPIGLLQWSRQQWPERWRLQTREQKSNFSKRKEAELIPTNLRLNHHCGSIFCLEPGKGFCSDSPPCHGRASILDCLASPWWSRQKQWQPGTTSTKLRKDCGGYHCSIHCDSGCDCGPGAMDLKDVQLRTATHGAECWTDHHLIQFNSDCATIVH